jgi:probable O-glycosylation ligase (exosortase A-associated)
LLYNLLLIVFILEYMRPGTFIPLIGALKINTILPLMLFALSFLYSDPGKLSNRQILQSRESVLLLFLLALVVVSIFSAEVTLYSFEIFKTVLGYIFISWIIFREVNNMDRFKGLMAVIVFVHVMLILLNPAIITDPSTRTYLHGVTFLGDGNDFGLSVLIAMPMALFLFQDATRFRTRCLSLLSFTILFMALIGTQSRGATLGLACVLFYLWLHSRRKITSLALIGILGLLVFLYASPQYYERIESIAEYQTEGSAQGRITAWKAAVKMAVSHPLTGVGAGHFPMAHATDFIPPDFTGLNFPWKTAHSIYFLALGELGIPGLIFIILAVFGTLHIWERRLKILGSAENLNEQRIKCLLLNLNGALVGYGAGGAFLSALYYPHIFVLMGLYMSARHIIHREYPQTGVLIDPGGSHWVYGSDAEESDTMNYEAASQQWHLTDVTEK